MSPNLQFQLKLGKTQKNSGVVLASPLERLQPITTSPILTSNRPELELKLKTRNQQGGRASAFEDDSGSLLRTDLFGKLTRNRQQLDLGAHFKYDLHPEEKLASEYWGESTELM